MTNASMDVFGKTFRHLQRYREILSALTRHGFGDVVHALGVEHFIQLGTHGAAKTDGASRPERLVALLVELGPTFIKAGQYLSNRSDLLPEDYLKRLATLQDRVAPFPFAQAREIIEEDMGLALGEAFAEFGREPLAAASIAQIHSARLRSGESVVVKVQRPDIRRAVSVDLEILRHIAQLMERHLESWRWRRPSLVVEELGHSLEKEMDFLSEAAHQERFERESSGEKSVYVPRLHRDRCSGRVLTMERVEGVKADETGALWRAGIDPGQAGKVIIGHFLRQIFVHGFFHADPHPGNIFIKPGPVVCYVDFGMMGRLDRGARETLIGLLSGIVARDEVAVARSSIELSIVDAEPDMRAFEGDVAEMLDLYAYRPVKEVQLGRLLRQLFEITARHRLRVPPALFLLAKTVGNLESLMRNLDPEFDVVRQAAPFMRRLESDRAKSGAAAVGALKDGFQSLRRLKDLPSLISAVLRQARRGRLMLEFEHKGLEPLTFSMDRVSNRLSFAVLLASLVIGSSLMVHARIPPVWHGIPVIGLGGFLVAALMSAWLLLAIIRHGRM